MKNIKIEKSSPWYHGSPYNLETLLKGSTITQNIELARVFSHKPRIVIAEDNGEIKHNGTQPGFLYQIVEEIKQVDVTVHPHSTMDVGQEWLTTREFQLRLVCSTEILPEEILTPEEIEILLQRMQS